MQLPLAIVVMGRDAEFAIAFELMRSGIFELLSMPAAKGCQEIYWSEIFFQL